MARNEGLGFGMRGENLVLMSGKSRRKIIRVLLFGQLQKFF